MAITVYPAAAAGKVEKTAIITSTQAWVAPADVTSVDIFLVAGGGGGGGSYNSTVGASGGGGGGGGIISGTFAVTSGSSYTVTIGAGGAAAPVTNYASNGGNSSFGSIAIAYGGGGGETAGWGVPAGVCGTGGGGGIGVANSIAGAGGGSGAPLLTYAYNVNLFFNISDQLAYVIQGTLGHANRGSGVNQVWPANPGIASYGAGGGGATGYTSLRGYGGQNAGNGAFMPSTPASAAVANRGGGGGGGLWNSAYYAASAGGSGVCIIKYWSAL